MDLTEDMDATESMDATDSMDTKVTLIMENRLSKEYINDLPIVRFEGEVVVVPDGEQGDEILGELMGESLVGFDTESKPSFTKGTSHPVSVVQLSTLTRAFLFQLKKTGFSDRMVEFLENENIKKIGVGVKSDIVKLQELRPFTAGGFVDLSTLAAEKGIIQVGVRGLTARYLQRRLPKTAQKTNWAKPELSRKQQLYAASDAWVCLCIYPQILADSTDYRQFIDPEQEKNGGNGQSANKSDNKSGNKSGNKSDRKSNWGKSARRKSDKLKSRARRTETGSGTGDNDNEEDEL